MRGDHGDAVFAVGRVGVADDGVTSSPVQVEVDVGAVLALGREEALEGQLVAQGVDRRDAQRVRHDRAGRRTTPHGGNALLAGEGHELVHDQEVVGEAPLLDDAQLHLEPRHGRRREARVATTQPLDGARGQASIGRLATFGGRHVAVAQSQYRRVERGQTRMGRATQAKREALGHFQRGVRRLGQVGEGLGRTRGRKQPRGVGHEVHRMSFAARCAGHHVGEEREMRDGQARAMHLVLRRPLEEHAMRAHDGAAEMLGFGDERSAHLGWVVGHDLGGEVGAVGSCWPQLGGERAQEVHRRREHHEPLDQLGQVVGQHERPVLVEEHGPLGRLALGLVAA